MFDLERERKEFIKKYKEIYKDDDIWSGWLARAKMGDAEIKDLKKEVAYLNNARKDYNSTILNLNKEISDLKQKLAESEAKQNMWRDEKKYAIKRWSDIKEVCDMLKRKLSLYENQKYVSVPRDIPHMMDLAICDAVYYKIDVSLAERAYKAMIESMGTKNA